MLKYTDSLGLAPIVRSTSVWRTNKGRHEFLNRVKRELSFRLGQPVYVDYEDVSNFLRNAVVAFEVTEQDISEAVECAVLTLLGRVNMRVRLSEMAENPIRVQPRGCDERDKSELYYSIPSNSNNMYSKYLAMQARHKT